MNNGTLEAAETKRFYCAGDCSAEFELTLEPKAQSLTEEEIKRDKGLREREVKHCPFCGATGVEEC
jgi:hypothetical protein